MDHYFQIKIKIGTIFFCEYLENIFLYNSQTQLYVLSKIAGKSKQYVCELF